MSLAALTPATVVVDLLFIALNLRLLYTRMYLTYAAFTLYIFTSTIIALLPNPTHNIDLWRKLWMYSQTVLLILLIIAVVEVLWFALMGWDNREEIWRVTLSLFCVFAAALMAAFALPHPATTFATWAAFRQFANLGITLAMLFGVLYIKLREIKLNCLTQQHLIIFTALLAARAVLSIVNRDTGIVKLHFSQATLIEAGKYITSICLILWLLVMRRPARHWWTF